MRQRLRSLTALGLIVWGLAVWSRSPIVTVVRGDAGSPAQAQPPAALTAFEVATIKPTRNGIISGDGAARVGWDPGGTFRIDDGSVGVLLRSAYPGVVGIRGLSGWATTAHYDVLAKAPRAPTGDERSALVRRLLADRFKLVAHVEQEERETYALRVARPGTLGPALKRAPVDCNAFYKMQPDAQAAVPPPANEGPRCGTYVSGARIVSGGITMERLAGNLRSQAGRVVIDETSLPGDYELKLETDKDLSIFTALREQLGLTLEPSRAMLPVLVVDRIEPPTPD